MKSLGLIGLGLLGSAMSERFMAADYSVMGFDSSAERREQFKAAGGVLCDSARAVFQNCETVILSLPNSGIVAEVISGCLDTVQQHLIVDTTTGAPDDARKLAALLEGCGACYLDATVVGSSEQTRQGEVVTLVGGTTEGFAKAASLLKCFSAQQFHTGGLRNRSHGQTDRESCAGTEPRGAGGSNESGQSVSNGSGQHSGDPSQRCGLFASYGYQR